jgi:hypothetical protein
MLSSGSGISSVAHQLSCFGVWFSLCLITGGLFLCLAPFLWDKVSYPSAGLLLSTCWDGFLIIFQICSVTWLWMLLNGSGDELSELLSALFLAVVYHPPAVGPPAFPTFVYWKFVWRWVPCSSPLLWCTFVTLPLLCVLVFISWFVQFFFVFCFFFFLHGGVSLPRGYAGLSQGWLGE